MKKKNVVFNEKKQQKMNYVFVNKKECPNMSMFIIWCETA